MAQQHTFEQHVLLIILIKQSFSKTKFSAEFSEKIRDKKPHGQILHKPTNENLIL